MAWNLKRIKCVVLVSLCESVTAKQIKTVCLLDVELGPGFPLKANESTHRCDFITSVLVFDRARFFLRKVLHVLQERRHHNLSCHWTAGPLENTFDHVQLATSVQRQYLSVRYVRHYSIGLFKFSLEDRKRHQAQWFKLTHWHNRSQAQHKRNWMGSILETYLRKIREIDEKLMKKLAIIIIMDLTWINWIKTKK